MLEVPLKKKISHYSEPAAYYGVSIHNKKRQHHVGHQHRIVVSTIAIYNEAIYIRNISKVAVLLVVVRMLMVNI